MTNQKDYMKQNPDGTYSGYFDGQLVCTGTHKECYSHCIQLKKEKIQSDMKLHIKERPDGSYAVYSEDDEWVGHNGTYEDCLIMLNGIISAYISPFDFLPQDMKFLHKSGEYNTGINE